MPNQFTHYRWRKEFGGLKTDQVKRLKELEKESEPMSRQWIAIGTRSVRETIAMRHWRTRLRKAVCDLTLEKLILREAASGTGGPRQRNF